MAKSKHSNSITFPYNFEANGRIAKIYKLGNGTFKIAFKYGGKIQQTTKSTFEGCTKYLEKTFETLDNDKQNSPVIYRANYELKVYEELEQKLRIEGDGVSLREVVDFYLLHRFKKTWKSELVKNIIPKFLEYKRAKGNGSEMLRTYNIHLNRFAEVYGEREIHTIKSVELDNYVLTQKDKRNGKLWSPKTKKNVRGTLRELGIYAQTKLENIEEGRLTEFQKITKVTTDENKQIEIYKAEELKKLLNAAIEYDIDILVAVVILCFSGIRSSEFHSQKINKIDEDGKAYDKRPPLQWENIQWDKNRIYVEGQKVRSRATRFIPIQDCLKAWLEPFKNRSGNIWDDAKSYDNRIATLKVKAGIRSIANPFRRSYASYRMNQEEINGNQSKLALEMGNSDAMITRHYKQNVSMEETNEYFSILPPENYTDLLKAII